MVIVIGLILSEVQAGNGQVGWLFAAFSGITIIIWQGEFTGVTTSLQPKKARSLLQAAWL